MPHSRKSPLVERRIGRVKDRARKRQQWLEKILSKPPAGFGASARRQQWITVALDRIRQAQTDVTYRARVLDDYSEHLHVLEMTLLGAAEQKSSSPGNQAESKK